MTKYSVQLSSVENYYDHLSNAYCSVVDEPRLLLYLLATPDALGSLWVCFMCSIRASAPRKSLWQTGQLVALGPPRRAACCWNTTRCCNSFLCLFVVFVGDQCADEEDSDAKPRVPRVVIVVVGGSRPRVTTQVCVVVEVADPEITESPHRLYVRTRSGQDTGGHRTERYKYQSESTHQLYIAFDIFSIN